MKKILAWLIICTFGAGLLLIAAKLFFADPVAFLTFFAFLGFMASVLWAIEKITE